MEEFKSRISALHSELTKLNEYTEKLDKKIREKSSTILNATEEDHLNREIKAIENIFKENSTKVKNELCDINAENEKMKNTYKHNFIYETRNSHWQALTHRLRNVLTDFRSVQVNMRNMEEQKAVSQYLIENPDLSVDEAKLKLRKSENSGRLSRAEERNKRVMQIVESINELCVLIDELHEMVKSQRGMIDKIEVKMSGSKGATERAKKSLQSALQYQISATRMKRIIFLILLVVFAVVIGIVVWKVWPKGSEGGGTKNGQNFRGQGGSNFG